MTIPLDARGVPITFGHALGVHDRPVRFDVPTLLEGRLLVVGSSGSGKSYLVRVICEQLVSQVPTIILDREGEFSTLRERHDMVLVGEDGEADTAIATAAKLARTLVELGVSAVINLYDLSKSDRRKFVRLFLDALLSLPRHLWRPLVLVLDEAHDFAPESGECESRESVIRLMDSGRKRGICGILNTQRFSKLAKDCASEAANVLIGRTALDTDLRRASDTLGFAGKSEWPTLRGLEPGEWFAFGPALNVTGVTRVHAIQAKTTHPKAGQRHKLQPPAPSRAILKVAPELAVLKQKVEAEQSELDRLRAEVQTLRRTKPNGVAKPDPAVLQAAQKKAFEDGQVAAWGSIARVVLSTAKAVGDMVFKEISSINQQGQKQREVSHFVGTASPRVASATNGSPPRVTARPVVTSGTGGGRSTSTGADERVGTGGMKRILVTLAQHRDGLDETALSLLARIALKGGTFRTYLRRLRHFGWIEDKGDTIRATDAGVDALGQFDPLPAGDALREHWLNWCGKGGQRRLLEVILEAGESGIDEEDLARASDLTSNAGTFRTYLRRLRHAKLLTRDDERVRASPELLGGD